MSFPQQGTPILLIGWGKACQVKPAIYSPSTAGPLRGVAVGGEPPKPPFYICSPTSPSKDDSGYRFCPPKSPTTKDSSKHLA